MTPTSKQNDDALEEAFRLIATGNEQEDAKDHWKAADLYSQARGILQRLSTAPPSGSTSSTSLVDTNDDEHAKITSLYRQKSEEYLRRARGALILALQEESDVDDDYSQTTHATPKPTTLLSRLSEEECFYRMNIFGRLFGRELEETKTMHEKESALSARLQELSDSLPATFKSEAERVRDLNRGLARLGLSSISTTASSDADRRSIGGGVDNTIFVPQSESEQVEWILAQAKDEVRRTVGSNQYANDSALAEAAASGKFKLNALEDSPMDENDDGDDDIQDDSVEFSTSDDDADLTPEICKDLHLKMTAAQVSLSELVALFDVDQGNDAAIEFEQPRGKALLRQTRLLLREVTEKWAAC